MPKYAFITGASRGIGAAIAHELATQGYHLYLTCLTNGQRLQSLADELSQTYSVSCQCFVGDIGDYSFVERCFAKINTLDVLVNNAGISYVGLLSDMEVSDWNQVMHTNLSASFYTSKLAIPLMLKKHEGKNHQYFFCLGKCRGFHGSCLFCIQGRAEQLYESTCQELAPSNIQVNALACGVIDTDMNKCFSVDDMEILKGEIPADRIGTTLEAAKMVSMIIHSPSYLTGQIITMDGGWQ